MNQSIPSNPKSVKKQKKKKQSKDSNYSDLDDDHDGKGAILTPPLQPNSPQEILSFAPLDLALRSHPELAREGASILNPWALSRLVQGIRSFQELHLGIHAKTASQKSWPMVRLPDKIFRSRSSSGPLFTAFLSAYRQKKESSWRQFDFVAPKRYNDNLQLLRNVERDLNDAGMLRRPIVYFDDTVPHDKIEEYTRIIVKYGGKVTKNTPHSITSGSSSGSTIREDDEKDINTLNDEKKRKKKKKKKSINNNAGDKPTHIVAWDPEEHDSEENLQSEQSVSNGETQLERLYLKTLTVVDPKKSNSTIGGGGGGIIESTLQDSKKKGGKVKGGKKAMTPLQHPMALVHWWYWPPSSDEWMLASEVAGEDENNPPARPKGGPWVVSCKFIRDVDVFNEWGMEADYAIVDYEKKVTYFKILAEEEKKRAILAKKERKLQKKNKQANNDATSSTNDVTTTNSDSKKSLRIRLSVPESNKQSSSSISTDKRMLGSGNDGMNPRQIQTGFYTDNGSKIRRTVYDGALRISSEASDLTKCLVNRMHSKIDGDSITNCSSSFATFTKNHKLPPIDSVLRPSEEPLFASSFVVTELRAGPSGTTLIANKPMKTCPKFNSMDSTQRIRGGGDDDDGGDKDGDHGMGVPKQPADESTTLAQEQQSQEQPSQPQKQDEAQQSQPQPMDIDSTGPDLTKVSNDKDNTSASTTEVAAVELTESKTVRVPTPMATSASIVATPVPTVPTPITTSVPVQAPAATTIPDPIAPQGTSTQVPNPVSTPSVSAPVPLPTPVPVSAPITAPSVSVSAPSSISKSTPTPLAALSVQSTPTASVTPAPAAPPNTASTTAALTANPSVSVPTPLPIATPNVSTTTSAPTVAVPQSSPLITASSISASKTTLAPIPTPVSNVAPSVSVPTPIPITAPRVSAATPVPQATTASAARPAPQATPSAPSPKPAPQATPIATPSIVPTQLPVAAPNVSASTPPPVATSEISTPAPLSTAAPSIVPTPVPVATPNVSAPTPAPVISAGISPKLVSVATPSVSVPTLAPPAATSGVSPTPLPVATPTAPIPTAVPATTPKTSAPLPKETPISTTKNPSPVPTPAPAATPVPIATQAVPSTEVKDKEKKVSDKPENVSSSNTKPAKSKPTGPPKIIPLPTTSESKEPEEKAPLVADQEPTTEKPSWYDEKEASDFEKCMLPEWFNQSAGHRTPTNYITSREKIIDVARKSNNKYITATATRRCVDGDAGSILRLHQFLVYWGFINGSAMGDMAPTGLNLNKKPNIKKNMKSKTKNEFLDNSFWSEEADLLLANAVIICTSKKRKHDDNDGDELEVDWDSVAKQVGGGVTGLDCQRRLMSGNFSGASIGKPSDDDAIMKDSFPSAKTESETQSATKKHMLVREDTILNLVDGVNPKVIEAATSAALKAGEGNIDQAQKGSLLGIIASKSLMKAKEEEDATEKILQEILDQRMKKLENRVSILEDIEGIIDAERVSLELERRDLYTARCRHWFA